MQDGLMSASTEEAENALAWLKGIGTGAAAGAATGAAAGPWGALVGGVLGAGLGAVQTAQQQQAQRRQQRQQRPRPAPRPQPRPAPAVSSPRPAPTPSRPAPTTGGAGRSATSAELQALLPVLLQLVQTLQQSGARARESDEQVHAEGAHPTVETPTVEAAVPTDEAEVADALGYAAMLRQLATFAPPTPSESTEPLFLDDDGSGEALFDEEAAPAEALDEALDASLEEQLEIAHRSLRELGNLLSSTPEPTSSPAPIVIPTARWTG